MFWNDRETGGKTCLACGYGEEPANAPMPLTSSNFRNNVDAAEMRIDGWTVSVQPQRSEYRES